MPSRSYISPRGVIERLSKRISFQTSTAFARFALPEPLFAISERREKTKVDRYDNITQHEQRAHFYS